MTIDSTKPVDQVLNALWPLYIRENRVEINEVWNAITGASAADTTYEMGAGESTLEIGVDIADIALEVISLTGAVAVNLEQITKGSGGMLKTIRAGDGNVTIKHDASYMVLNGGVDLALAAGNIIGLVNIGGDTSTSLNGIWYEVFRVTGDASGNATYTAANMTAGQTSLVTGTDINNVRVEVIGLTADAAVNLTTMSLGEAGVVKHIIALDDDITVVQNTGSTTGGTFFLNAPAGVDLAMQTRDVLSVTNIGGDGVVVHGYWLELNRKLQV